MTNIFIDLISTFFELFTKSNECFFDVCACQIDVFTLTKSSEFSSYKTTIKLAIFIANFFPRAIFYWTKRGKNKRNRLNSSISSCLPACAVLIGFGPDFAQIFFNVPCYLNLCHRASNFVICSRKI